MQIIIYPSLPKGSPNLYIEANEKGKGETLRAGIKCNIKLARDEQHNNIFFFWKNTFHSSTNKLSNGRILLIFLWLTTGQALGAHSFSINIIMYPRRKDNGVEKGTVLGREMYNVIHNY